MGNMKEHHSRLEKHSRKSHKKKSHNDDLPSAETSSHRSVLKERHCKEVSPKRSIKKHHKVPNKESHQSLSKEGKSEHRSKDHHKSAKSSSHHKKEHEKHKNKRQNNEEESFEELSRKKKKIESELQALDMEEAEQKDAENKNSKRHSSENGTKAKVRVKEEPVSDDDQKHDSKRKIKNKIITRKPDTIKKEPDADTNSDNTEGRWGISHAGDKRPEKVKEKPNFATSGKLAEDTNTFNGVVIKYNEPTEARKPRRRWRLYPFKGDSDLPFIPIHRQSAYLFGRTRKIADIPIDHPSCSKQHAVFQYRLVPYMREDGTKGRRVRPYIIDLESSNGTFVNNKRIDPRCYVELIEKDVIKFGFSSREYVLLHEESKNDDDDDEVLDSN